MSKCFLAPLHPGSKPGRSLFQDQENTVRWPLKIQNDSDQPITQTVAPPYCPHTGRAQSPTSHSTTPFLAVPCTSPSPTDCSALLTSIPVPLSKHHQYRPASRSTAANIIHVEAIPNSALHHLVLETLHDPYGIMKVLDIFPRVCCSHL